MAQSSIVDRETNNVSIQNVVEQVQFNVSASQIELFRQQNPAIGAFLPINFAIQIISLWRSVNPQVTPSADVEIEIFDSIGQSVQKADFKLQFEEGKGRMRTIITLPTVNVSDTGLYLFKIMVKEEGESTFTEVSEIPLEVLINKQP